ncbi:hypothetical protein SAMN05661093_05047 [Kibdelosporangium aridum]|uniref:Uncharacterized protein n=1 Tax=Kibdelosporangium aridum TaxID=2030 RepID=A0A1Y5XS86_KIBAR|nr:hypothetical protein SAMN05661093_05047 [Kibdelosporangium aridum]
MGDAGCSALADFLFDPDLPSQVAQVADEREVHRTVAPPDLGVHHPGHDRAADGQQQHRDDDALAEGVFRSRGAGGSFWVEAAAARPVGARGDTVRGHVVTIVRFVRRVEGFGVFRSRIHIVDVFFVAVVVAVGVVGFVLEVGGVAHVGLLGPAFPHDPRVQCGVRGSGDLLALAHDHRDEDDQPRQDERHHDE